jgi:hypothetical protein
MALGFRLSALGLSLTALTSVTSAQSREPRAESQLQVYLVTVGQGEQYWEKYGHNMLMFRDPARKVDLAYNWGTFDFKAPDFLARQLVGDPQYWVDTIPTGLVLDFYRSRNRTIVAQRLNFTPEQAARALALAQENIRPENRFYRYDYFRDNCSTRIRDLIDNVLGGALKAATERKGTTLTYQSETVRLLDDMKLPQFGVQVALGRPANRHLNVWEAGFIPMRLRDAIRDVRVAGAGGPVPLVAEELGMYTSAYYNERDDVPALWGWYLLIGVIIAIDLFGVGLIGETKRGVDIAFRIEASLWALVTGVLGVVIVGGWAATQHIFWYRNENVLLFNPLSLFLAALLVMSIRNARWLRPAAVTAILMALMAAVALIAKGLPGVGQDNLALVALVLPAHFAIAFGLWRRANAST